MLGENMSYFPGWPELFYVVLVQGWDVSCFYVDYKNYIGILEFIYTYIFFF